MTRYNALMAAIATCVLIWQECAENPALFCYRIGTGAFANMRSRGLVPAPVTNSTARNNDGCSNPSGNCSTESMT
jgi:hypothetical protein